MALFAVLLAVSTSGAHATSDLSVPKTVASAVPSSVLVLEDRPDLGDFADALDAGNSDPLELVLRATHLQREINAGLESPDRYGDLPLIDDSGVVDLSTIEVAQSTRLNEELEELQTPLVNAVVELEVVLIQLARRIIPGQ